VRSLFDGFAAGFQPKQGRARGTKDYASLGNCKTMQDAKLCCVAAVARP
jgi:hypothetical protein